MDEQFDKQSNYALHAGRNNRRMVEKTVLILLVHNDCRIMSLCCRDIKWLYWFELVTSQDDRQNV